MSTTLSLTEHFAAFDDPRVESTKLHPLLSVVVIAISAVIAGAESWDDIEEFGEIRAELPSSTCPMAFPPTTPSIGYSLRSTRGSFRPASWHGCER